MQDSEIRTALVATNGDVEAAARMLHDQMLRIVITVPHATCPNKKLYHRCDHLAPRAARKIFDAFPPTQNSIRRIFLGTVPRTECALHRRRCREHPWRQEIRKVVTQNPEKTWVLDVHSYPPEDEAFGPYDIVLLDDPPFDSALTQALSGALTRQGLTVGRLTGSVNDIMQEARELGARSILIEFNENLRSQDVTRATNTIAATFAS